MRRLLILLVFLLNSLAIQAQGVRVNCCGTRPQDTALIGRNAIISGYVALPMYAGTDTTKFPWIDANGNMILRKVPAGGGSSAVSSVFGRTGDVTAQSGDYTYSQISGAATAVNDTAIGRAATAQTNLNDTASAHLALITGKQSQLNGTGLVRMAGTSVSYDNVNYYPFSNPSSFIPLTALSSTATGLSYSNTSGIFSLTSGYSIPTNAQIANWNTAFSNMISSLTTTGSSGAATLSAGVLNIPTPTLAGLGGISLSALSAAAPLNYNNSTGVFSLTTTGTAGSYGTALQIPVIYTDAYGRIYSVTPTAIGTLNQNTTGTAANITATTNSTIASLPNLTSIGTITSLNVTTATIQTLNATTVGTFPVLNQNTTGTSANITGVADIVNGGTNATTQTSVNGAVFNYGANNTVSSGVNAIRPISNAVAYSMSPTGALTGNVIYSLVPTGNSGQVVLGDGTLATKNSGTVTAFAATINSGVFSVSVTNATTTPTLNITTLTQNPNTFFAGATSGTTTPTFRAITAGDLPALVYSVAGTTNQINVSGTSTVTVSLATNAALPGSPTTTTPSTSDNSTKIATTAFTQSAITATSVNTVPLTAGANNTISIGVNSIVATGVMTATGTSTVTVGMPAASTSVSGYLPSTDWNTFNGKQPQLSGTGFIKATGTTIIYDNSTYITTAVTSFSVSGSTPVFSLSVTNATTTPTLNFTTLNQNPNTFLAGATSGTTTPTFRAIVAGDLPAISLSSGVTGTLPVANGGTGATTQTSVNAVVFNYGANNTIASSGVNSIIATGAMTVAGTSTVTVGMPAATGSINGYITSTDWTTFNNKGSGTVTSVGLVGSSTMSVTGTTSPITGSGTYTVSIPSSVPLAGSPTTTTQSPNDNSTKIATTAYVDAGMTAVGVQTIAATSYSVSCTPTTSVTATAATVFFDITAQAGAILFNAPTGTWANHQHLQITLKDNGTARAITYNAIYRSGTTITAPTTTILGKELRLLYDYDANATKFDLVAYVDGY